MTRRAGPVAMALRGSRPRNEASQKTSEFLRHSVPIAVARQDMAGLPQDHAMAIPGSKSLDNPPGVLYRAHLVQGAVHQ